MFRTKNNVKIILHIFFYLKLPTVPRSENLKTFSSMNWKSLAPSVFNWVQTAFAAKSVTEQLTITPSKNISLKVAVKNGCGGFLKMLFIALFIRFVAEGLSRITVNRIA